MEIDWKCGSGNGVEMWKCAWKCSDGARVTHSISDRSTSQNRRRLGRRMLHCLVDVRVYRGVQVAQCDISKAAAAPIQCYRRVRNVGDDTNSRATAETACCGRVNIHHIGVRHNAHNATVKPGSDACARHRDAVCRPLPSPSRGCRCVVVSVFDTSAAPLKAA